MIHRIKLGGMTGTGVCFAINAVLGITISTVSYELVRRCYSTLGLKSTVDNIKEY